MIGRLVKEQEVRGLGDDLAEEHPASLAARQHPYLLQGPVAVEHHRPADVPDGGFAAGGLDTPYFILDRYVRVEPVDIHLPEISLLHVLAVRDRPGDGLQHPGQNIEKRRLALAVLADDPYPVALFYRQVKAADEVGALRVGKPHAVSLEEPPARKRSGVEGKLEIFEG